MKVRMIVLNDKNILWFVYIFRIDYIAEMDKQFKCKSFSLHNNRSRHEKYCTNGDLPVKKPVELRCNNAWCRKKFDWKFNIDRHTKKCIAKSKKTYTCTTCSKNFESSYRLARHEATHTIKPLYMCSTCSIIYERKDKYDNHILKCAISDTSSHSMMPNPRVSGQSYCDLASMVDTSSPGVIGQLSHGGDCDLASMVNMSNPDVSGRFSYSGVCEGASLVDTSSPGFSGWSSHGGDCDLVSLVDTSSPGVSGQLSHGGDCDLASMVSMSNPDVSGRFSYSGVCEGASLVDTSNPGFSGWSSHAGDCNGVSISAGLLEEQAREEGLCYVRNSDSEAEDINTSLFHLQVSLAAIRCLKLMKHESKRSFSKREKFTKLFLTLRKLAKELSFNLIDELIRFVDPDKFDIKMKG